MNSVLNIVDCKEIQINQYYLKIVSSVNYTQAISLLSYYAFHSIVNILLI